MLEIETRTCTLREMVEAMSRWPDDTVFRWFQTSCVNEKGGTDPTEMLKVTLGQARIDLGIKP